MFLKRVLKTLVQTVFEILYLRTVMYKVLKFETIECKVAISNCKKSCYININTLDIFFKVDWYD